MAEAYILDHYYNRFLNGNILPAIKDPLYDTDKNLMRKYRFPRQEIINMNTDFGHIFPSTRDCEIPTLTKIMIALRFFASGSFQQVCSEVANISQPSCSRIIEAVSEAFYQKAIGEIKMPNTHAELFANARAFSEIQGMPKIIGAIDCTHILLKAPTENENSYVNRKGSHSVIAQVSKFKIDFKITLYAD